MHVAILEMLKSEQVMCLPDLKGDTKRVRETGERTRTRLRVCEMWSKSGSRGA